MRFILRAVHRATGRHVWRLALDDGQGRRPATVHLMCRPCRITKPLPEPTSPVDPCFCRTATCDRWQQYVARYVSEFGVAPTRADIEIDERLHAFKQEWIDAHGVAWRGPFLAALLSGHREVTG